MKKIFLFIGFFLFIFLSTRSLLLASQHASDAHTQVDLVSEMKAVNPGTSFQMGLLMQPEKGWHLYWKNPGDFGLAPTIKWNVPTEINVEPFLFPTPERIQTDSFVTYGYTDAVLFPIEVHISPNVSLHSNQKLDAQVEWLACKEECVPGKASLSFSLPVDEKSEIDPNQAELFKKARKTLPVSPKDWRFEIEKKNPRMILKIFPPHDWKGSLENIYFFPEDPELLKPSAEQKLKHGKDSHELVLETSGIKKDFPSLVKGILRNEDGWKRPGYAFGMEVTAPIKNSPAGFSFLSFIYFSCFAFLGGLILNLMPCVLPVLSFKILGLVNKKEEKYSYWKEGILFSAGVIVSFWILAGILFFIKFTGKEIGWGFQLQSPGFVLFLLVLFFLMALNLFGLFEFAVRIGIPKTSSHYYREAFLNGVLATIVATPCTAPFMGVALGFALTQPILIAFAIFTFLGLGMSFPYLLITCFPNLHRLLPKPGSWMEFLKQILAFPVLATSLWLFWILFLQKGSAIIFPVLTSLLLSFLAAWLFGKGQFAERGRKVFIFLGILIFIAAWTPIIPFLNRMNNDNQFDRDTTLDWLPYSEETLQKNLAEGKNVFLDFTAAWCLTCQLNERVALHHPDVVAEFKNKRVILLKADWTNRDEKIAKILENYGRSSIPFYVLYPAGENTKPIFFSEILTANKILSALKRLHE